MKKIVRLFHSFKRDKHPVRRVVGMFILRSPFDIYQIVKVKIKVKSYYIYLRSSSMSVAFWRNPSLRDEDYEFLEKYLRSGDVYVDVGANIGTTLVPAAQFVDPGVALGFEPHPRIYSFLVDNISLNGLEGRVGLHNCALGRERGELFLSSNLSDDQNSVSSSGKIRISTWLLDDFVSKYESVSLLKVDVEGYEKSVLDGGSHALSITNCVYFEVSTVMCSKFGYSVDELYSICIDSGLLLYRRVGAGRIVEIDLGYVPAGTENIFAIRDLADFIERTGWLIERE